MNLQVRRVDDAGTSRATVTSLGALDLSTSEAFVEAGMSVISAGYSLALDLSGIDFMDSAGVSALVALSLAAERESKIFEFLAVSARVLRVLEITGLAERWAVPRACDGTLPDSTGCVAVWPRHQAGADET